MDIIRFLTAGSVDDGKSTLIGRLLYDSNALASDLKAILEQNKNPDGSINLALLTDGLKAEREQGITIDVAYKYFSTKKRKYIIADSPGHIQYTRNMVTAASNSDVAIILVDARKGITEQTKRHAYIAYFMGIRYIALTINKMDLVNFSEEIYHNIKKDFESLKLDFEVVEYIPLSALKGDNVVFPSENMPWYKGKTLFDFLENVEISQDLKLEDFRFPIQYVIRPNTDEYHDFRGYAGRVLCGEIKKGSEVLVLPAKRKTKVKEIYKYPETLEIAENGASVTLLLEDDIDISRGDMLVGTRLPYIKKEIEAQICWMSEEPLTPNTKLFLRHTTKEVKAIVKKIISKIDIQNYTEQPADQLELNDIGKIQLKLSDEIFYDPYTMSKYTGSFILIDNQNQTVAGGVIIQMLEYSI
ncbi:MAG: sulfate adenylyltransferase subunit 1 [Leptospiraceae bacterium]|nr:MAG: sulfate adenylyltransferase subunit 1 [Leptospiraceae bacterium]